MQSYEDIIYNRWLICAQYNHMLVLSCIITILYSARSLLRFSIVRLSFDVEWRRACRFFLIGAKTEGVKIEAEELERGGAVSPLPTQLGAWGALWVPPEEWGRAPTPQWFSTIFSAQDGLSWHYNNKLWTIMQLLGARSPCPAPHCVRPLRIALESRWLAVESPPKVETILLENEIIKMRSLLDFVIQHLQPMLDTIVDGCAQRLSTGALQWRRAAKWCLIDKANNGKTSVGLLLYGATEPRSAAP